MQVNNKELKDMQRGLVMLRDDTNAMLQATRELELGYMDLDVFNHVLDAFRSRIEATVRPPVYAVK